MDNNDIQRLAVLAIKHIDRSHHDWDELMELVEKFDPSEERIDG